MFERYTELARRALFFARYEASIAGSLIIESEHVLLGLLRNPGPIARRVLAGADASVDQLRQEVQTRISFRERVALSAEMPFSEDVKRILTCAADEADSLGHSYIDTEHILLAILRAPLSTTGAILRGHGLRLQTAREAVVAKPAKGADAPESLTRDLAAPVPEPAAPRLDTEGIVPEMDQLERLGDIDRIQRLVERIRMTLPTPYESNDLFDLLDVELASLRRWLLASLTRRVS